MNGVVVKSVDEVAVRRAMDAYAARLLAAHPEVEEIVVFGSFAEGNWEWRATSEQLASAAFKRLGEETESSQRC